MANLREPVWEKQHNENFKLFGRFQLYRDMGANRTMTTVSEEVGVHLCTINDQSRRWRWVERADAWDRHLDDLKRKAIEDASHTMSSRQAKLGMVLQDKAINALEILDMSEATPRDIVAMAESGVKIERLARGEKVDEGTQIILQLPSIPGWARQSKLIQAEEVKLIEQGDIDGRRTENDAADSANESSQGKQT